MNPASWPVNLRSFGQIPSTGEVIESGAAGGNMGAATQTRMRWHGRAFQGVEDGKERGWD